jgi:hypothetical protein
MKEITAKSAEIIRSQESEITDLKTLIAAMIASMGEIKVERYALQMCQGDDLTGKNIIKLENLMDNVTIYKWKGYGTK